MHDIERELVGRRIVAVIRGDEAEAAYQAAQAAWRGGISVIEMTLTTPGATELIARLRSELPDAQIGAGSVVREHEAAEAVAAGAQFFVSPHSDRDLVRWFRERDLFYIPGCLTPTELVSAHHQGCRMQKLFPASVHGPSGVRGILQPLPFLHLVVTGGVDEDSAPQFLAAGAKAVCVGSQIFSKARMHAADWSAIERDCARMTAACAP